MRKRFRYCLDPVPLVCTVLYLAYRFWAKHTMIGHIPFFHDHFNDVLCLPIFLPPVLWVNREIGLRTHDGPPTPYELIIHLVIWSLYFEGLAPLLTKVYRTTADPLDVAAYAVGGLAASLIWGTWRRHSIPQPATVGDASPAGVVKNNADSA
jgi:hypothetical protein